MKEIRLYTSTRNKRAKPAPDLVTLVDDIDYEYLSQFNWYCLRGYAIRTTDDRLMHRVIMEVGNPKITIDHINANKLDNRRSNLRVCTQGENSKNRSRQCDNKSGYKGVYWDNDRNKWRANISVNNKTLYIGLFSDIVKAARAYDEAAKKYYGNFAKLNFSE